MEAVATLGELADEVRTLTHEFEVDVTEQDPGKGLSAVDAKRAQAGTPV
jgi:uncharacterized protein (DUF4213/DUF364 family)